LWYDCGSGYGVTVIVPRDVAGSAFTAARDLFAGTVSLEAYQTQVAINVGITVALAIAQVLARGAHVNQFW
jgi:hypothetical protein